MLQEEVYLDEFWLLVIYSTRESLEQTSRASTCRAWSRTRMRARQNPDFKVLTVQP